MTCFEVTTIEKVGSSTLNAPLFVYHDVDDNYYDIAINSSCVFYHTVVIEFLDQGRANSLYSSLSFCVSVSLRLCVCVCVFLCLYFSHSLSISVYVSVSVHVCV